MTENEGGAMDLTTIIVVAVAILVLTLLTLPVEFHQITDLFGTAWVGPTWMMFIGIIQLVLMELIQMIMEILVRIISEVYHIPYPYYIHV